MKLAEVNFKGTLVSEPRQSSVIRCVTSILSVLWVWILAFV